MSESRTPNTTTQQTSWARPVNRLTVPDLPKEAIKLNVEGRRLASPLQGFGQLWQKTYAVRLEGASVTPAELLKVWRERFGSFWPAGNHFYGAERPIAAGDVAQLNLTGPLGTTVATGLMVIYADDDSFSFMTVEGHILAGLISFSAYEEDGTTVAQVQPLGRGSDPLFELSFRLGISHKVEDEFWCAALKNLAAHFGVHEQPVSQRSVLVDSRMQWSEAKNLWHNAAVRTTLHAPLRWVRRLGKR